MVPGFDKFFIIYTNIRVASDCVASSLLETKKGCRGPKYLHNGDKAPQKFTKGNRRNEKSYSKRVTALEME